MTDSTKDQEVVQKAENLDLAFLVPMLSRKVPKALNLNELVKEYKRFLALKVIFEDFEEPFTLSPSALVDLVWHLHISYTKQYRLSCSLLGATIDHNPDAANDPDKVREKRLKMTKALYTNTFAQKAPEQFWKLTEDFESFVVKSEPKDNSCTSSNNDAKKRKSNEKVLIKSKPTKKSKSEEMITVTFIGYADDADKTTKITCLNNSTVKNLINLYSKTKIGSEAPILTQRFISDGKSLWNNYNKKLTDIDVIDGDVIEVYLEQSGC